MAYQRKAGEYITFWRVNHDTEDFSNSELQNLLNRKFIAVNGNTEIEMFTAMRCKDYFYLCHGNDSSRNYGGIKLIGRIVDHEPKPYVKKDGWFQRSYEVIFPTNGLPFMQRFYYGSSRPYTPVYISINQGNIKIYEIQSCDADDFEKSILQPFFNVKINIFAGLWSSKAPLPPVVEPPKKIFPLNQIFYGPPGTGKTYLTRRYAVAICDNQPLENADANKFKQLCAEGRVKFVTFHQSYGYEDFIEGIKPLVDERGNITYKVKAGVFKEFCDTARNKNWNFVFIIDEINRGNVSKIFGELITLIEDDKRGELSATLPYSQKEFTVPQNVYLIGTMNTADRSIALLDTALRRRFNFVEMMPRPELLSDNIDGVNLQKLLDTLNTRIETHLDREHTIGHAYFINCKTIADIAAAFRNKIIPLLQEYFFDDYALIQEVLGKKIIAAERLTDEKFRYTVNDKALLVAETYSL